MTIDTWLVATDAALDASEITRLAELETTIERGLHTFVDVGNALLEIRDGRLYRSEFSTFEAYCRERWGMVQRHANRLIAAAETASALGPIGPIPATESQARPLTALPAEMQPVAWQRAVETAPDGKITAAHVQSVVDGMKAEREPDRPAQFYQTTNARQDVAVTVFSSESNEYYTPPQYIDAAREVMGGIDLDPATCEAAQRVIAASTYYTETDDGLSQPWYGRVWMNPPYGKIGNDSSQGQWAQKLVSEYKAGNVAEGIFLVKAAVGYEWFEVLWDELPVCFSRERLSFVREDGSFDGQSKQGTAFFYVGQNVQRFIDVFRRFGRVILPEAQL